MKGPSSERPTRSRGTRSHGAAQAPRRPGARRKGGKQGWIWGHHAVRAVLANPRRTVHELVLTASASARLPEAAPHAPRIAEGRDLDALLPPGAAHQGCAVRAAPLEWPYLDALAEDSDLLLVLDGVTDPHNLGAMLRLASAFGVGAVVLQDRNSPPLTGAAAKVAAGCVETVPVARVTNISDTLEALKTQGYFSTGLAGDTPLTLQQALSDGTKHALVMGAEGPGLRPRVAKTCDQLARIPMRSDGTPGTAESLNVATAAAVALYEARRNT